MKIDLFCKSLILDRETVLGLKIYSFEEGHAFEVYSQESLC
jgi:hypothetical protein